jgi:ABC-2 type transport system ATP-binding protein
MVGLLRPSSGEVTVLGNAPADGPEQLARVGFLAQDAPLYATLSVADHLRLGQKLNPGWDSQAADARIERLGFDVQQRAGQLSGGQRAQVALTLAVSKRPELLLLDEPVAGLDPLARREFLQSLMETVAEHDVSVVLSSHLISDIERVCDYLIVLAASRVRLAGDVQELLSTHYVLSGPRRDSGSLPAGVEVIEANHTDRQTTAVVRTATPIVDPSWSISELGLEDLILAYLGQAARASRPVEAAPDAGQAS